MFKQVIKSKLSWAFLAISVLMAGFMTFSYLGAFLSPADNTHNLPLAIVNSDEGVTIGGQTRNFGQEALAFLKSSQKSDTYSWTVLESREQVLQALGDNKYYAALVIPSDYSATLAALMTPSAAKPALIEVMTNPAGGTLAASQAQGAAVAVVTGISKSTGSQLVQTLTATGTKLSPQVAALVGDPVQATIKAEVQVGSHSARGMSAFYYALLLSLSAFVGTNVVGTLLDLFSDARERRGKKASSLQLFYLKAVLYSGMAVGAGLMVTAVSIGILEMDANKGLGLALFAILGSLAIAEMALFFQVAFGRLGLLVGLTFFTVLGVPSSGGPYPYQMLPGLWQWLYEWLPLRYLTDGARALIYMDGRMEAGLGGALAVLSIYIVVGLGLAWLTSYVIDRRNRFETSDGLVDRWIEGAVEQVY